MHVLNWLLSNKHMKCIIYLIGYQEHDMHIFNWLLIIRNAYIELVTKNMKCMYLIGYQEHEMHVFNWLLII